MNMLPVIDIPVTNRLDLKINYFLCNYRLINISIAAEILINAKV